MRVANITELGTDTRLYDHYLVLSQVNLLKALHKVISMNFVSLRQSVLHSQHTHSYRFAALTICHLLANFFAPHNQS